MKAMKWFLAAGLTVALFASSATVKAAIIPVTVTGIGENSIKVTTDGTGHNRNDCGAPIAAGLLPSAGSLISGDNAGAGDDFDGTAAACGGSGYGTGNGATDLIYSFTVDVCGSWSFTTCATISGAPTGGNMCPSCDTSLQLTDGAAGCPGPVMSCNGDQTGGAPNFCSKVQAFLLTGQTYFLIVDSYGSGYEGPFDVFAKNATPCCTTDAQCSDGLFCTGAETCNVATGACILSTNPCAVYQTCNELTDVCTEPDPCLAYDAGNTSSGFFSPTTSNPGCYNAQIMDEVELRAGAGRKVTSYSVPIIARGTCPAGFPACPIGSPYTLDMSLWSVDPGTALPLAPIVGCDCPLKPGVLLAGGSPAVVFTCLPANCTIPAGFDFAGANDPIFHIDAYIAWDASFGRVGFSIPASDQTIGGPGFDLEAPPTGVFALEGCTGANGLPNGVIGFASFGGLPIIDDFLDAKICTVPVGPCCLGDGTCEQLSAADCQAAGGTHLGNTTLSDPDTCDSLPDGDSDGSPDDCDECDLDPDKTDPGLCGCGTPDTNSDGDTVPDCFDNCDLTDNQNQLDTDGGGLGDACDNCINNADENQANADGDNHGDLCDICPGGNDADDADNDGTPDFCDGCVDDPNKTEPGTCGCGIAETGDSDGDGYLDCIDCCAGVDDDVFAVGCAHVSPSINACTQIPTVSEWGLIVLALLLLAAGKVYFGRRTVTA